jgi:hypothetical protein
MRHTLTEQQREERRRATAAMAKCPCGNVARHDDTHCGYCAGHRDERQNTLRLIDALDPSAEDFAFDLRHLLRAILTRIDGEA